MLNITNPRHPNSHLLYSFGTYNTYHPNTQKVRSYSPVYLGNTRLKKKTDFCKKKKPPLKHNNNNNNKNRWMTPFFLGSNYKVILKIPNIKQKAEHSPLITETARLDNSKHSPVICSLSFTLGFLGSHLGFVTTYVEPKKISTINFWVPS